MNDRNEDPEVQIDYTDIQDLGYPQVEELEKNKSKSLEIQRSPNTTCFKCNKPGYYSR